MKGAVAELDALLSSFHLSSSLFHLASLCNAQVSSQDNLFVSFLTTHYDRYSVTIHRQPFNLSGYKYNTTQFGCKRNRQVFNKAFDNLPTEEEESAMARSLLALICKSMGNTFSAPARLPCPALPTDSLKLVTSTTPGLSDLDSSSARPLTSAFSLCAKKVSQVGVESHPR